MHALNKTMTLAALLLSGAALAQAELAVPSVKGDLTGPDPKSAVWKDAPEVSVMLMAQPMVVPRPAATTTAELKVQAVHNASWLAIRLRWKDKDRNEAGRLGEFSDAAAVMFPVKPAENPPPVMMGAKDMPVHIFHWRAQYQRDAERGKPQVKDLYPNSTFDMYPMEFNDPGTLKNLDEKNREQFSPGKASGNPQSYSKTGVDEIYAEGFSTSSVQEGHHSVGKAVWEDGEWTLVIVRPLSNEGGSVLEAGKKSWAAFAVWQGGEGEVGSRKCVTMAWTPVSLAP
jgi:hypothetical protein